MRKTSQKLLMFVIGGSFFGKNYRYKCVMPHFNQLTFN